MKKEVNIYVNFAYPTRKMELSNFLFVSFFLLRKLYNVSSYSINSLAQKQFTYSFLHYKNTQTTYLEAYR